MRRLLLIVLCSLLLPAGALGGGGSSTGDGSLEVQDASGRITVQIKGLIYGHLSQGSLTVIDYKSDNDTVPQISGASFRLVGGNVRYTGADMRFLFAGGQFTLRLEGSGIDISAVGKGTVTVVGSGTVDDGSLAVNGSRPQLIAPYQMVAPFGPAKLQKRDH
jgi:hypothetical protein